MGVTLARSSAGMLQLRRARGLLQCASDCTFSRLLVDHTFRVVKKACIPRRHSWTCAMTDKQKLDLCPVSRHAKHARSTSPYRGVNLLQAQVSETTRRTLARETRGV